MLRSALGVFFRVAFGVGGAEELTWGRWLVVMDGNVSR